MLVEYLSQDSGFPQLHISCHLNHDTLQHHRFHLVHWWGAGRFLHNNVVMIVVHVVSEIVEVVVGLCLTIL